MTTVHPPFQFCICRPDGTKTTLIPLDQLPSWIWIPSLETADPIRDKNMVLASQGTIPRDDMYDAVCCNCYYTDDPLNRRAEEQKLGPFPPAPPNLPELSSMQKPSVGMPGAYYTISPNDLSNSLRPPFVKPLALETCIHSPMVGMCLTDCGWPFGGRLASFLPKHPPSSPSSSETTTKSNLNPEAPNFSPLSPPAPYASPDPTGVNMADGGGNLYYVRMPGTPSSESHHGSRSNSPLKCQAMTPQMPPSPPLTASSAGSDMASALEQPKKAVGVTSDNEECYSSPELDEILSRRPGQRKKIRGPLNKKSKRFRHVRRAKARRGSRRVSFQLDRPQQVNSATKRQERREKMKQRKNWAQSGQRHRYWHKMLLIWRVQAARN